MNLEHAKQVWSKGDRLPPEELARRADAARQVADQFESGLLRRDWTETAAALFVIVTFLPALFLFKNPWAIAGVLIIIAHMAGIIMVLWVVRKTHPEPEAGAPLAEYLRARRDNVLRQIKLLRAVPFWYVAPSLCGQLLFVYGISTSFVISLIVASVCVTVCVGVCVVNLRAARTSLPALRDTLNGALADLANEGEGVDPVMPRPAT